MSLTVAPVLASIACMAAVVTIWPRGPVFKPALTARSLSGLTPTPMMTMSADNTLPLFSVNVLPSSAKVATTSER
jgi:hypothetical protein